MSNLPSLELPETIDTWRAQREQIRATLNSLLGDLPPPVVPQVEIVSVTKRDGLTCEHFRFHNGDPLGGIGATVTGYLVLPENLTTPAPALQYCHWHGGQYDLGKEQIWRPASRGLTPAQELAGQGYVVLAIDAYGFGERAGTGPDGPNQRGGAEEMSLSKLNLWYGRTLCIILALYHTLAIFLQRCLLPSLVLYRPENALRPLAAHGNCGE